MEPGYACLNTIQAAMDEDDFLWQCAFIKPSNNDTQWIVPNFSEEEGMQKYGKATANYPIHFQACQHPHLEHLPVPIEVGISEIREFGVIDTVGGEVICPTHH